jgi:IMP dehydrogenase/GMP reductase
MILEGQPKYCLQDLSVVPAVISKIDSRTECNPFTKNGKYPIFCAPMNCVTDENNYGIWDKEKVQPILPRTVKYDKRMTFLMLGSWVALSQKEFEKLFADENKPFGFDMSYKVCIDTANAHRKSIYESVNKAKKIARDNGYELTIMVGNIARPDTYEWICENAEVDYVRLNIGSGKGCITASNTGTYYPIASLVEECATIKHDWEETMDEFHQFPKSLPKIVCDGGIRGYADIIVALALGADYVMIGSLFAAMDESCAELEVNPQTQERTRLYYGMSTKKAQKLINEALETPIENFKPKTSEGTFKHLTPLGPVHKWLDNFNSYLCSTMSYTDCKNLEDFTSGYVDLVVKSTTTIGSVNA